MSKSEKHARPGWYVVQVTPGAELRMCEMIKQACAELDSKIPNADERDNLRDCFSPRFATRKKRMGEWYDVSRPLLPGYVIADVRDPAKLASALRGVREFCRVLASDETYSPLDDVERRWVQAQSKENDRTIPLSFGYKECVNCASTTVSTSASSMCAAAHVIRYSCVSSYSAS